MARMAQEVAAVVSSPDKEQVRSVGLALLMLRSNCGMTQRAICEASGVTRSNLSRYESCRAMPRLDTLRRIVAAMGSTMEDLYRAQVVREEFTEGGAARREVAHLGGASAEPRPRHRAPRPGHAAAVRLAQECGKAVAHCCLAFMELQAGGWRQGERDGQ
jgi:transcriptional regulator with XRE-family HTH domain